MKGVRFGALIASFLFVAFGFCHICGWTYSFLHHYNIGGNLDSDTYTSLNKLLTRIIEGVGIIAFGITGILLFEQRKSEASDHVFKENLSNLLQQIKDDQTIQQSLNADKLEELGKSIHALQSQVGRKKKQKK